MRQGRIMAGIGALAVLAGLWLVWPAGPGPSTDRALPRPLPEGALTIVAFGTSLTAPPQSWPDHLGPALAACLGIPVDLQRVAGPGMGSDWGVTQSNAVAALSPDLILMEFAINDADLTDGVTLRQAAENHAKIVSNIAENAPSAQIVLMTMSPAQGLRGWIRPWLPDHYSAYRRLAADLDLGLLDLYPRWLALPTAARGLDADGLHPDPTLAETLILPAVLAYLGCDSPPGHG